ncbi:helix-turn-helix domain-containing protein [Nocardia cyriacigeorgica]|nr:helix-turn-helix domain-containing protein [Nocardia cyriacigeorgica]MBF6095151.1 helix-turn-helix domain-containing protein [Nocardia cyriacigeorgica]MBF6398942.1 helix-turn-helix domain-containing protein [Nocardia cyriacigeorgica]MBF6404573.1 helix-turn-helix domain-containing protein [Nocardia cyriacigeorgica]
MDMSLLEDIHAGISEAELDARLTEALRRHEITEATAAAARGIHRTLAERREREELLRVLHETATDLTGIRDVEAVLAAIVRRTRLLTGSDMAYISLNDYRTRETYIRKSDGVITQAYRTIRMPIGTGVLGKAAAGLSPYQSSDYLADPAIVHLPHIDAIVRAEGVRAILGVPLNLHGSVIGALLIADRSPRSYPSGLIDLIDTVGKHAVVALDNAERFTEITRALDDLASEHDTHISRVRRLQDVIALDERLIETVVGGRGLDGFVDLAHQVLAAPAAVLDPAGGVLAAHPGDWVEAIAEQAGDAEFAGVVATGKPLELRGCTVVPAKAGGTHLATLVLAGSIPAGHSGLLDRLAIFLTVLRLFDQAAHDSAQRQQFEVLDDILSGRGVDPEQVRRRAARFGLRPGDRLTSVVIDVHGADHRRIDAHVRRVLGTSRVLVAEHGGHLCVLVADGQHTVSALEREFAAHGVLATIGYAGPVAGLDAVAATHRQAERALSTLVLLGRAGQSLDGSRLGAVGLLLDAAGKLGVDYEPLGEIAPLIAYDRDHGTALTETAWTFLETNAALADTAARLFIHRNTVRQRLARIAELLGADWLDTTRRLDLHLALRIWKLGSAPTQ